MEVSIDNTMHTGRYKTRNVEWNGTWNGIWNGMSNSETVKKTAKFRLEKKRDTCFDLRTAARKEWRVVVECATR